MSLKKLVTRIRNHFPGSIAHRNRVWIKAEPPLLCGFCLEASGRERGVFQPWAVIIPTYVRKRHVILTYTTEPWFPANGRGTWYFDEKDPDRIVPELVSKFAGPGMQFLDENGRDISCFLAYLVRKYSERRPDPHVMLATGCGYGLMGKLDEGIRALAPLLEPHYASHEYEWVRAVSQQGSEATAAMRQGEAAIRWLLDGWSRESLVALGIAGSTDGR